MSTPKNVAAIIEVRDAIAELTKELWRLRMLMERVIRPRAGSKPGAIRTRGE
jgi:hypothetical protein